MTKSMPPGRSDVGIPQRAKVKHMNVDGARRTENPPHLIRGRQLRRVCFKVHTSLAITPKPDLTVSKSRNIQRASRTRAYVPALVLILAPSLLPPLDALAAADEEYRAMWLAMLVFQFARSAGDGIQLPLFNYHSS
jgi:hypothetical protein